jgi:hypothetical protein
MDPGPIWRSRNQVLGDLIGDPTNDERREWMRVQRETGTVPEDLGDGGAIGNGEPQRGIVGDLLPQKLGGHYDGGPQLALIEESDIDRTIAIETLGVGTTEFDLSEEWAMGLFRSGRTAAEKFLADYQTQGSMERPTMAPRTP